MDSSSSIFATLPDDVVKRILYVLAPNELAKFSSVCKRWNVFANSDQYWQHAYISEKTSFEERRREKTESSNPIFETLMNTEVPGNTTEVTKRANETWKKFYVRWRRSLKHTQTIMDRVFSFLPSSDLSSVSNVSHAFKESVLSEDDTSIWSKKCAEEFGELATKIEGMSWKETYQFYKNFPDQRPSTKRRMLEYQNNNSGSRIKAEDVATLMEIAGVSEENARDLLLQSGGDVQSVLRFMFG